MLKKRLDRAASFSDDKGDDMQIDLSTGNAQFLQDQVAAGAFQSSDAAVEAAIGLLRRRTELLDKVRRSCDQMDRGEYVEFDEDALSAFFASLFGPDAVSEAPE
jgi:Arc/MetJ-type ribon-helix-helix transcriptional regulator